MLFSATGQLSVHRILDLSLFRWNRVKLEINLLHPEVADNLIAGVFSEEFFLQDEFLANGKKMIPVDHSSHKPNEFPLFA